MAINFAALSVRIAIQIARHTSQLHSAPLKKSAIADWLVFANATVWTRLVSTGSRPPPPQLYSSATKTEPKRLPTQVCGKIAHIWPWLMVPAFTPRVRNIVWPVNSSEPAIITRVNAMPKVAPITSGRTEGSSRLPRVKIRMMPRPT